MPKRKCAVCGKEKSVEWGKICQNDHFICRECVWISPGLLGVKRCPLCNKPMK